MYKQFCTALMVYKISLLIYSFKTVLIFLQLMLLSLCSAEALKGCYFNEMTDPSMGLGLFIIYLLQHMSNRCSDTPVYIIYVYRSILKM